MVSGFIQLRRGILEHLKDGRISALEFAVFSAILLLANHRNWTWFGSGNRISQVMHMRKRTAQRILVSLRQKGYLRFTAHKGTHVLYPIFVPKASNGTREAFGSVKWDPREASNGTHIQEVVLNKRTTRKNPAAKPAAVSFKRSHGDEEQQQNIEARDYRLRKEAEARKEVMVGHNWLSEQIHALAERKALR